MRHRAISQKELEQADIRPADAPRATCAPRAMRCASSARPMPRSIASSRSAASIRRWWCRARSPAGSPRATPRPGLFVQPGNPPAPVHGGRHLDTMWMLANVAGERQPGVPRRASGEVDGAALSRAACSTARSPPSARSSIPIPVACWCARRSTIRSTSCAAGMFANFVIRIGAPVRSPAVPLDGVVREGDGTMTVWVTADRRRFTQAHRSRSACSATAIGQILDGAAGRRTGRHRRRDIPEQHALRSARNEASAARSERRARCRIERNDRAEGLARIRADAPADRLARAAGVPRRRPVRLSRS